MAANSQYGASVTVKNLGNQRPSQNLRIFYEISGPSTNNQWTFVDDDTITPEELEPGKEQVEGIYKLAKAPSVAGNYRFRVRADADSVINESDENNNITETQFTVAPLPSITVTNPTSSDKWKSDQKKRIEWRADNFGEPGRVDIDYSQDGGSSWGRITSNSENDGGYDWDMCKFRTKDGDGYIRITSTENSNTFGVSQRFKIDHKKKCK